MALPSGTRLGPYEILSPIGAGGMGEVYKARDTRLDRAVAVKVLPDALSTDPQFRDRFDREARVISQLEHPHICSLYDVGVQDGTAYLVMQLLEGETLATRLERGPVPLPAAVAFALQIADALVLAHRSGIVHRDLKPGNVMLTPAGVRLLDFGLATVRPAGPASVLTVSSPTIEASLTAEGTIMGTFEYMAPEQIEGDAADAPADIWAFGCVLYEMLTGARPFAGKSAASVIASILGAEPQRVRERQPLTPDALDDLVHRCLEKDPDERWQSMVDVRHQLRQPFTSRQVASRARWREPVVYGAALLLTLVTAGVTRLATDAPAPPAEPVRRLLFSPQEGLRLTAFGSLGAPHFALSPEGDRIAYVASAMGKPPALWVQRFDSRVAQPIPHSDDASSPFWSPDGAWIGFFAAGRLKTATLDGDSPSPSLMVLDAAGGTTNGAVILIGRSAGSILSVPVHGSVAQEVTTLGGPPQGHRWPQFLPDGSRFIFTERNGAVRLASLKTASSTSLLQTALTAVFAPPGFLLYPLAGGTTRLMAQPFDESSGQISGQTRPVIEKLGYAPGSGYPTFAASRNGLLAYWDGTTVATDHVWFDRQGRRLPTLPAPSDGRGAAISPDGKSIAYWQNRSGARPDIWLMDAVTGAATRFSFLTEGGIRPIWVDGGREIGFSSIDNEHVLLVQRLVSGQEKEQIIARLPVSTGVPGIGNYHATDWSPDGRLALVSVAAPTSARDIAVFDRTTGELQPLLSGPGFEIQARFSPDGRWMAYSSNETGRWEVFVEPFPVTGRRHQVSTDGGSQPVWRKEGGELFFAAPDGNLMSVNIRPGQTFTAGPPQVLFQTGMRPTYAPYPTSYDVSADGQRFLIDAVRPETAPTISIVTNWTAAGMR